MKIVAYFFFSVIAGGFLCYFNISVGRDILNTLYNALCVVFSVGMGLLVAFSYDGIKNIKIVTEIRKNIRRVRKRFILLFSICTILVACVNFWHGKFYFGLPIDVFGYNFTAIFFCFSIGYFIYNYTIIQTLKEDIYNRILQEEADKRNAIDPSRR